MAKKFDNLKTDAVSDAKGAAKGGGIPEKPRPEGDPEAVDIEFLLDVPLEVSVELGRTKMVIDDLLKLSQGSVIALDKGAGETLEILANRKVIARGEVVVVKDRYGVRVTEIMPDPGAFLK
jgi:flagellar motor switch protein FliN